MTARRILILVVLTGVFALAGCGESGGGGGGGGGGEGLAVEAAQAEALMDRLEALPSTATTAETFTTGLEQIRSEVQQEIEDVARADAPPELAQDREKLASRLRELRTQLGRIASIAKRGDLEAATGILEDNRSIASVREAAIAIQADGG